MNPSSIFIVQHQLVKRMISKGLNNSINFKFICLLILGSAYILASAQLVRKHPYNPLDDNNNKKYNPEGILKKKIKHCEVVPYDIDHGVLKKRKETYKMYFDKQGIYYKEEKYHLGHLVEYTIYQFDNAHNLREAKKYTLFPERKVTALAQFKYDRHHNVTYQYIEEGERWNKIIQAYDKHGNLEYKTRIRRRLDKKNREKIDTAYYKVEYEYDDSNRVVEKMAYKLKGDKRRLLSKTNFTYFKGEHIKTQAKYNRKDELVFLIKYEYEEYKLTKAEATEKRKKTDIRVLKQDYFDKDMELHKEVTFIYNKWGDLIQSNSTLEDFERLGTKTKFSKEGNIVWEEIFDNVTNKHTVMWKYTYFHEN